MRLAILLFSRSALAQDPTQNIPGSAPVAPGTPPQTQNTPGAEHAAQDSSSAAQGEPGQFVFRKQVEEVVLHALVVDGHNNIVTDLSQSAFQVYEDGKQQQITSFHQERIPVALGILIDNSGSMRPKRAAVNQAALNLPRSSSPQDEIFVVNFGEAAYLDQDFTNHTTKIEAALRKIETRGSTALYDAIVASASHLQQQTTLQKRALLVVTDGEDNASQESMEQVVQQLQQNDGPVVYVIALLNPARHLNLTANALLNLCNATGGAAYFPSDVQQVELITRTIASAIRRQYVVGYKSSSTAAGHVYHSIQVQAYDLQHHRLRVQTRKGYYSDSPLASR